MPAIADYDGPLGALEARLARRRIAVGVDGRGQICLVRPDSVVLEFDEDGIGAVERIVGDDAFEVLGRQPGPLVPGMLAARRRPVTDRQLPGRWVTGAAAELMEELRSDRYRVRLNHVYLADGVTRHFGIVDDRSSTGTPGFVAPHAVESTARPAAAPTPFPAPLRIDGRRAPNVLVLDSGLRTSGGAAEHPVLDSCVVHEPWLRRADTRFNDEDEPDDDASGRLDAQAGHGTFISGIIRRICPDATIHTRGVLSSFGDGDDASIDAAIKRAVATIAPIDVVVMAFGTYGEDDLPTPAMTSAIARLPSSCVLVGAAGNDATSRPYFPAAMPGVIGVGALDGDRRAAFSNFGPWVDACAPGVDVVSTFFREFDETGDRPTRWRGWATWSGTSFAAPVVAALVARRMYLDDCPATDAWGRLSAGATARVGDLGLVFNA